MPIDLHLHTHHSDGTFAPEEVVRRAKSLKMTTISITDHDTLSALPAARAAAGPSTGSGQGLEILTGIELTATSHDRELHVLGYGFRDEDPAMRDYIRRAQERRHGRIHLMIDQLNARGIKVTRAEVEAIAGEGTSIGRPHLAEALLKRQVVHSLNEAFDRYIGDHAPCFVRDAILTTADAALLIRQAGGIAVLAHPYRLVEDDWIPEIVANGIQGIEAYHSDHDPSVTQHYREIAREFNLLTTGGSDCHGFRKSKGPLIGTVKVPEDCLLKLKDVIASEAKQSHL
jgi:hypothetical protein